jgi:pyruvate/2-oxoglutarate dehydrogenase complex dihydrolipoamide dehydrogenase (E3) component
MYDVIVIGGGPAGVTAALRARELGASVALAERDMMGGTCTNDGCVPTRVLAKAARLLRDSEQFAAYGLDAPRPTVDFARLLARTQQVVYQVQEKKQLIAHLEDVKADVFYDVGPARFLDPHRLGFPDGRTLEGKHFIICAGGHARKLDFPGGEHALVHSDVWSMTQLPASVAIIGGGATGCQLASIFNDFGSSVVLLDIAPRLLPPEDTQVSETMTHQFVRQGIEVITGIESVRRIEKRDRNLDLVFTRAGQEHTRTVEVVIESVGWPGNLDALNLPAAGVETRGPYIQVDDYMRTSAQHIFAAGDITGRMMLVQSASFQARVAAENAILGVERAEENKLVPHGGFTDPEYASVGLTEEQARVKYDCAVALIPYSDMDRAVIDGHDIGFCKLIVDRSTHLVVGVHVVGEQAVEVVHIVAAACAGAMQVEKLAELEFAYPTFAAVIGLAARQLARELHTVPIGSEWRELRKLRIAEWERQDGT